MNTSHQSAANVYTLCPVLREELEVTILYTSRHHGNNHIAKGLSVCMGGCMGGTPQRDRFLNYFLSPSLYTHP